MAYIKFNNDVTLRKGNVTRKTKNLLSLKFETSVPINSSGFKTYRDYALKELMGDFTDYTTIYDADTYSLSNDGSVKPIPVPPPVPPIQVHTIKFSINQSQGELIGETTFSVEHGGNRSEITPPTVIASDNYQFNGWNPSIESGEVVSNESYFASMEYIPTLEEVKAEKVAEMNNTQQMVIQSGANVTLTDGTVEHFTLTGQDQTSLMALQSQVLAGAESIPWHTSDTTEHCKYYSNEDMGLIVNAALNFITFHVTYFRDLRIYINSLETKEEVNGMVYGVVIPEEYQSQVLSDLYTAMEVTNE